MTNPWEPALGVHDGNTTPNGKYRRKFNGLRYAAGSDDAATTSITVVGDATAAAFERFEAPTRMALARAAMYQVVKENLVVARFGLYKTRQAHPIIGAPTPLTVSDPAQRAPTETASDGRWNLRRGRVVASNGQNASLGCGAAGRLVAAQGSNQNTEILDILQKNPRQPPPVLLPAGLDRDSGPDAPLATMVNDATEAVRCLTRQPVPVSATTRCAILITGGGEGTSSGAADPVAEARVLLRGIAGRRVPIVVVAIAPPIDAVAQLTALATESGGQYLQVTRAQIDAALKSPAQDSVAVPGTVVVPELVNAINLGVQTAFERFTDLNTRSLWSGPWPGWAGYRGSASIPSSEFQVATPLVGTVNLTGATDIHGAELSGPQPPAVRDTSGNVIPQRNNLLVTSGFVLPGFDGIAARLSRLQAGRRLTRTSGYRFEADNTPLWIAAAPADPDTRNLFTALPDVR
jgi:hypothetical protein